MASKQKLRRYRINLADELHGAAIYETLARVETEVERRRIFSELADSERKHAQVWADKLKANHQRVRTGPGVKTVLMKGLVHVFGPRFVLPSLAAAEFADRNKYAGSPETAKMSEDERHHASVVQALANDGKPMATKGAEIADAESWHRGVSSGNDLRAAVLGANDGLVSNFCLIMGVAGAGTPNKAILLTALAGIIAGACSMALGEWLSVTNARELAATQIAKEADELEHTPEAEEHELRL
ncbi:VIT1/CCC1 transporter family protein, partial [Paraburkholderia strydomiana]|uniref:VIT1/CCC1 transporter family protein n=1 Tax=Paraburkholderia strydomiana TaxID=1245417 RepID=UPI0038B93886